MNTTSMAADPVSTQRRFAGRPDQVAAVRDYVAGRLCEAGSRRLVDDAVLCVCELVTNAIRHSRSGRSGGEVFVCLETSPDAVTCHVHDQGGSTEPAPRSLDRDRVGGRGLAIVAELASACGCARACRCGLMPRDGWCVWFRLDREVVR